MSRKRTSHDCHCKTTITRKTVQLFDHDHEIALEATNVHLDRVHEERTSFGSCSLGEEDFVWIVFIRRGGLPLDRVH